MLGNLIPGPGLEKDGAVPRLTPLLALAALAATAATATGCAGPALTIREGLDQSDLQARLAARGHLWLGQGMAPFEAGGERFNPDCSGFVEAVYAAEGVALRRLAMQAAPAESSGVAALWAAAGRFGSRWRGGDWPAPGDLVFFDDTWDRNGNGARDDPFTHIGLVEWVDERGTVTFLHRAGAGVVRGHLTLERRDSFRAADGAELNAFLRVRGAADDRAPALAGELFVGFGRIDPARARSAR
jgi:probable lipoprotein NlpC